ncbi:sulfotransferase family 2 domain-containing protein [Luteolibacter yonseiensis]|uniref:Sulfotransferase family 2 domain-containing protein n=1 Tax=Luteolibacter yonseiensis TaxID=1144680 RepID=A0A934R3I7_9BACT|nr:sulfotransferase family 2 domain-containing protein [Luteolibacter yonseiensis]MBK1816386.1 sulfotransferase family 2 domain-containing protein [Luteolibacter yonseiensis]
MQGILCSKHSIGYLPLPKVANTSLKHAMFMLENGVRFSSAATGVPHIHHYYRHNSVEIDKAAFRFVVIRDPIKRFLSAYSNRVIHHRELSEEKVRLLADKKKRLKIKPGDFELDPDLSTFIRHLEKYQKIPSILIHTRPQSSLVTDLGFFSKVYRIESMDELGDDLSEITNHAVPIRHSQSGGPKIDVSSLAASELEKLRRYYQEDYRLLSRFYSFDDIREKWAGKHSP